MEKREAAKYGVVFHMSGINLHQLADECHVSMCQLSELRAACRTASMEVSRNFARFKVASGIQFFGAHRSDSIVEIVEGKPRAFG